LLRFYQTEAALPTRNGIGYASVSEEIAVETTLPQRILSSIEVYSSELRRLGIPVPRLHVVLGSGIGSSLVDEWIPSGWKDLGSIPFSSVPAVSSATAPGHPGLYRFFQEKRSKEVLCLQVGRLHGYEGLSASDVALSAMIPRLAGTPDFILTNAAGGLKLEWSVGSVMMIRDHVNLTGQNPLIGPVYQKPDGSPIGPRFPDFSNAWERRFTESLRKELAATELETHEGVYLGILGPNFETPAEVRLFSQWGMGAVGMSTVWEAIALVHSGARVAGFSLVSNLGCGLNPGVTLDHFEILEASKAAAKKITSALFAFAAKSFAG
jgi:purine-nucleoside phosphorylase